MQAVILSFVYFTNLLNEPLGEFLIFRNISVALRRVKQQQNMRNKGNICRIV